MIMLVVLMFLVSSTPVVKAEANYITKSMEPAITVFNQGEIFTVTIDASITEEVPYTSFIAIKDEVIYPAMHIVNASYTVTGSATKIELEQRLGYVQFNATTTSPVTVTITYKAVCSMAGTFYLQPAHLSFYKPYTWTHYTSGTPPAFGPLTIVSNAEPLLDELDAKITSVEDEIASVNAKVRDISGDVATIEKDLGTIKVQLPALIQENAALIQENAALIQQTAMYCQVTAILAAIACIGAWISVFLTRRKKA